MLWFLVEGVDNRAAPITRALIVPFVVAYTALGALLCLSFGAAVFSLGHAPPMGPVGMGLFLIGIAWAEFWPRSAPASDTVAHAAPSQVPPDRGSSPPRG